jgi:putative Holliday junction resolvase
LDETRGRILAFDYGSKRIGVAVSDPLGITAQPLPAIRREGDRRDVAAIAELATRCEAVRFVFGLPLHEDGNEGKMAGRVRAFSEKLLEATGLPVEFQDERFTTAQAERMLIEAGVRREKRKEVRDSLSAVIILQGVLDLRNRR